MVSFLGIYFLFKMCVSIKYLLGFGPKLPKNASMDFSPYVLYLTPHSYPQRGVLYICYIPNITYIDGEEDARKVRQELQK